MFITTNVHSANQMEPLHSISGEKKKCNRNFFFFQQFLSPLGSCFGFSNDYCVNDSGNMKLSLVEQNINKLTGIQEDTPRITALSLSFFLVPPTGSKCNCSACHCWWMDGH